MSAAMREAVVAEAMSWLRTPYHHGAGLKGIGTDCARFPLAVYAEAGAIPPTDVGVYARDWHLHHGEELYLGWLNRLATEIERDRSRPAISWSGGSDARSRTAPSSSTRPWSSTPTSASASRSTTWTATANC